MADKRRGPATDAGKELASRNAITHGIMSTNPVIEGMEREADWRRHLDGIVAHFAPEGALEQALAGNSAFIGLVASSTKAKEFFKRLRAKGIPTEALQRVHTPLGLDIKVDIIFSVPFVRSRVYLNPQYPFKLSVNCINFCPISLVGSV